MSIQSTEGRAFTCRECGLPFSPARGGHCTGCDRILCDDHFYGAWWRRLLRSGNRCVSCRAGGQSTIAGEST